MSSSWVGLATLMTLGGGPKAHHAVHTVMRVVSRHYSTAPLLQRPTEGSSTQQASLKTKAELQIYSSGWTCTDRPPQNSRYTPRCPSVVLWTPCSGCGVACVRPTIRVWRSGSTGKQPANLAVEAAEESLSILPDYTPTVRPPPKRCS
jgi:hypothetical protein